MDWIQSRCKYYYNCSTIWREADIQKMILNGVVPCHPDRKCEGDHDCYGPKNLFFKLFGFPIFTQTVPLF